MTDAFERMLAIHCAPTLRGMKPASLISLRNQDWADIPALLRQYNQHLSGRDLHLRALCACERRTLVLVYREQQLAARLREPEVGELLASVGYGGNLSAEECLEFLGRRIGHSDEFPHEIGIVLGYPLADVVGFIQNDGQNPALTGYWKVYDNVEQAKQLFREYGESRQYFCQGLAAGRTMLELIDAA